MDDNDLTELARGVVPFVHEAIAETLAKVSPLPPDLLEQIKAAAEILQQPTPPPRNAVTVMPDISGEIEKAIDKVRRVARFDITRTGQLAAFYSDGTSELLGPVIGPPGEKGQSDGTVLTPGRVGPAKK
jgi:hypothetical protein